jgi:transposase InsO family protein
VKFAFISAEKAWSSVSLLCSVLEVSRSGYYAWCARPPSQRTIEDGELAEDIRNIHHFSKQRYGSPRIHEELAANDTRVGRKRVARLMKENGLSARIKRRFVKTTDSRHDFPVAPNLLQRDFTADAPNEVWVGDITYLDTREGWLYLAVLIDLYSRRVVGWAMSERIDTALAMGALNMALARRNPPRGLIHHTDRGCQYASHEYRRLLRSIGAECSMSRKGDCWDNAVAESFFASLRKELTNRVVFLSRDAARTSVFEYIEAFYNRVRRHSTNNYKSPNDFERDLSNTHAA